MPSVGDRDWYPLSLEQNRFYAVERFSEKVRSASIPVGLDMEGPLNTVIFEECLPILVRRHESLRTVVREVEGNPVQVVLPNAVVALAQHDLSDLDDVARQARIDKLIEKDLKQPFDLHAGPLYRFLLIRCARDKHVFLLAFHHIIADFLSIKIFLDELSTIYTSLLEQRQPILPELTRRYVDFSSWEKEFFSQEYLDTNLQFWRDALKNNCSPLALPYDRPNPSQQSFGCLSEVLDFESDTQANISAFCRATNLNKFVLYLAGLSTLVHGYTENEKLVIGIPLGNRNFDETRSVIGTFANQSVAIVDLAGDPSFSEIFARLMLSLYDTTTKVVPIIDIIDILRKEIGHKQRPLKVVLTYLSSVYQTNIPGVFSRPIKTGRDTIDVDLFFTVIKHAAGEALSIEYADSLFEQQTISDMLAKFKSILDLIISNPETRLSTIFSSKIFQRRQTIQIASTFVSEPVERALHFWMDKLKARSSIQFCPQGQVFQQLVDPTSAFHRNQDGYNVLMIRPEDWTSGTAQDLEQAASELDRNVSDFLDQLRHACQALAARTIVVITPGSNPEWSSLTARVEARLQQELEAIKGVSLITSSTILSAYDIESYYDATRDDLGHIPYTDSFYVSLGTAVARRIFSIQTTQKYKVVVVDCDNTLWKGVVGEDGVEGIVLGESSRAFQQLLVGLQQSGMLVCLCSKNSEQDVLEVFAKRSDMVLQLDQIVSRRINWQPKSENLQELALELNLGLDSFVFIDDNPAECAEVTSGCPEVLALQFPSSDDEVPRFLKHTWLFDRDSGTREDQQRTQLYKENAEREQYRRSFASYRTFIENLDLQVEIEELCQDDLMRVSQLTYRTNQFNTTTIRRSEAEISALLDGGYGCSTVKVRDRFGDYGLVGVLIYRPEADELVLDSFLLSCRALGKGVEHRMIATLGSIAAARSCERLKILTTKTAKNQPVMDCLDQVAGPYKVASPGGAQYVVPTAVAQAVAFFDVLERQAGTEEVASSTARSDDRRPGHLHAEFLNTTWKRHGALVDVEAELGTARKAGASDGRARAAATTDTEVKLVEICCDVIEIDGLGVDEDIFDVGGTSFDVVKIISRIKQTFDISFDHLVFLRSPIVRDVAYQIDHYLQHGTFDDGVGAIDLEAEAKLAPEIAADGRTFVFEERPKNILVTGATGFLGAHLVRELLEQTAAVIHCHVRANSQEHGIARVVENLKGYQIWRPEYGERLAAVLGDLAMPRLGMLESEYDTLSRDIAIIYHNGSIVDFVKPYRALKEGNVRGTEEVLRFACAKRIKPVVYVSTVALFNSLRDGRSEITEEFVQRCDNPPLGGYAQSKWVAERLVTIASSRGLPVCILRPGEIAGSGETGHLNKSDVLSILFHAMVGMNCLPHLETTVDFIPVDLLSRMMVRIASTSRSIGRVYNMVHPEPVGLVEYTGEVNALGMDVKLIPYREWTARLASYANETNDDHIRSLMHLFTQEIPGQGKTWIESTANRAKVAVGNTLEHLTREDLKGYRIDRELIGKYLRRLDTPRA